MGAVSRNGNNQATASDPSKDVGPGKGKSNQLEQVRELLFGREAQEQREMIGQLRETFLQTLTSQESNFERRLQLLTERFETQFEALTQVLEQEQKQRNSELQSVRAAVEELAGIHDTDFAAANKANEKLATRQKSDVVALKKAIATARQQLKTAIGESRADLDVRKADRAALAKLFHSLADRIDVRE